MKHYLVFASKDETAGEVSTPMPVTEDQAKILKDLCNIKVRHKPMVGMVEEYILNDLRFEIFDEQMYLSTFNPPEA